MCGRYALNATPEEVRALFGYFEEEDFPPRYNIAPTQPIATVRAGNSRRHFALVRWGLVPRWVKDPASFRVLLNARSEEVLEKPAFKFAMRYRRCLIPASGYYEWRKDAGGRRQAFWLKPAEGHLIALAGLWETWIGPNGEEIDSGTILTTRANAENRPIHDRMPVVVAAADFDAWLDTRAGTAEEARALLRPAPDGSLVPVAVGPAVNKADNDGPGLQEPMAEADSDAGRWDGRQGRLF